ncbi:hypothetical protein GCM10010260_83200 [Streptomyces filipinensis]|uniref:Secreted protein n=1 Tax=Streptomyces filipinensis TaxID=66887 RepID=A0A918MFA0_9ACTN|nr:hypothetical protein GCM10010260_83200 [Streptomyces filipinensis]
MDSHPGGIVRRLVGCLLALAALLGLSLSAPQPASADVIGSGASLACEYGGVGAVNDVVDAITGQDHSACATPSARPCPRKSTRRGKPCGTPSSGTSSTRLRTW